MINIYYGSKKWILHLPDAKVANNLRNLQCSKEDLERIENFIKSESGSDLEMEINNNTVDKFLLSDFFKFIDAAGGLIQNEQNEYLFILRRNKWDLPKGKVDDGESIEEAAIREVKEECGIESVNIVEPIITTYHLYPLKKRFAFKSTYWYKMHATKNQKLIPQFSEDITDIKWLKENELNLVKENSFPSILDVIKHSV